MVTSSQTQNSTNNSKEKDNLHDRNLSRNQPKQVEAWFPQEKNSVATLFWKPTFCSKQVITLVFLAFEYGLDQQVYVCVNWLNTKWYDSGRLEI